MNNLSKIIIIFIATLILFTLLTGLLHELFGPELFGFQIIEAKSIIKVVQKAGLMNFVKERIKEEVDYPLRPFLTFYAVLSAIFIIWFMSLRFLVKDPLVRKFFIAYLVMSTLLFFVRLSNVTPHFDIPANVFGGTASTPFLYRIGVPFLSYLLKTVIPALTWQNSARIWNYIFVLSVFPLFHVYLRKWFDIKLSFLLNVILCCLLPLSFDVDFPGDFLELAFFIMGYMLIRDEKKLFLGLLIFLATFCRETALLLVVAYFVSKINRKTLLKTITSSFVFFICWVVPFVGIRMMYGPKPIRSDFCMVVRNMESIVFQFFLAGSDFFSLLFFLGLLLFFYLIFDQKNGDLFLKRNIITITIIFMAGFWFGNINEARVFHSILPILIPLAFYPLFSNLSIKHAD